MGSEQRTLFHKKKITQPSILITSRIKFDRLHSELFVVAGVSIKKHNGNEVIFMLYCCRFENDQSPLRQENTQPPLERLIRP